MSNKILPKRILIFRDGLSITQLKQKIYWEMKNIKEAIFETFSEVKQRMNIDFPPSKVTYISLNRKTNVKLFYYDEKSSFPEYSNCPQGKIKLNFLRNDCRGKSSE